MKSPRALVRFVLGMALCLVSLDAALAATRKIVLQNGLTRVDSDQQSAFAQHACYFNFCNQDDDMDPMLARAEIGEFVVLPGGSFVNAATTAQGSNNVPFGASTSAATVEVDGSQQILFIDYGAGMDDAFESRSAAAAGGDFRVGAPPLGVNSMFATLDLRFTATGGPQFAGTDDSTTVSLELAGVVAHFDGADWTVDDGSGPQNVGSSLNYATQLTRPVEENDFVALTSSSFSRFRSGGIGLYLAEFEYSASVTGYVWYKNPITSPVPEPSSSILLLLGFVAVRYRRLF